MSPELDKQLVQNYPLIFADRYKPVIETAMCWGFECGDGWYNILDTLCHQIQHHIDFNKRRKEVGVDLEDIPQVVAEQVKEKFGRLTIYYRGGDEFINGVIRMAENMSACTCEVCGSPGHPSKDGWIKTLCLDHHIERDEKYK